MLRSKRRWYTSAERVEMWDRWQRGESLNAIARAFETSHSSISKNFGRFGGIRPADRLLKTLYQAVLITLSSQYSILLHSLHGSLYGYITEVFSCWFSGCYLLATAISELPFISC